MLLIRHFWLALLIALALPTSGRAGYVNFESGPVRPLALSADGGRLFVVNTPDNHLEIFDVDEHGLHWRAALPVGLEPVAVAVRSESEVWVVNHLSDSVSVIDVASQPARVVRTLLVGDEPRDVVFAGDGRAFITAAHRGQNAPFDPRLSTAGLGRADVWVFDPADLGDNPAGEPIAIVNLFCDTPRALAVSLAGDRVYAAAFHSGNQTTTISQEAVCNGGSEVPACTLEGKGMPGGLPPPNQNFEGIVGPEVGLIVRRDRDGAWRDEIGRDWVNALRIDLPDFDVFEIDALAQVPSVRESYRSVGTVLYGMAVNPVSGALYVVNTEARNQIRFESRVRGHQHESRVTVIHDEQVMPVLLNPHLDYEAAETADGVKQKSLALPVAAAVSADGSRVFVAAFGSSKVAVIDSAALVDGSLGANAVDHILVSGGGPSGIVIDEARDRLYVATRFDDGISVIDLRTRAEIDHLQLHTPEPAAIINGRRFLYDADFSSSNGEATCASCHVFGDFDGLAWDLGEPAAAVIANPLPERQPVPVGLKRFHPLKGPMTTQTLRGIADSGAMHWRGDRTGGNDVGGDPLDPRQAFRKFDVGFTALLGRAESVSAAEMDAFADFALQIQPPPNPIRAFDQQLTPAQQAAAQVFFTPNSCTKCHKLDPALRQFGTDGFTVVNPNPGTQQAMKIPSLRGLYQKVGAYGIFPIPALLPDDFPRGYLGDQVRGFGFLNDGAGIIPPPTEEFLLAFDTNFAPIVGQQVTSTAAAIGEGGADQIAVAARIELLRQRAELGECDLVVHGSVDGRPRSWLHSSAGVFLSDRQAEGSTTQAELAALAQGGATLTYTCMPPDTGVRSGLDRDEDGYWNGDELESGSDPADPLSYPGGPTPIPTATRTATVALPTATPVPCTGDCDRGGAVTVDEIVQGVGIALGNAAVDSCLPFDPSGDGAVTVDELLLAIGNALEGCSGQLARVRIGHCEAYQ